MADTSSPTPAGQVAEKNKIGLVAAIFLVAGNMMGSGVFMLPANLAAYGSISLIGWLITTAGAVALALTFSRLTSLDPAPGGLYAFSRKAFGNYMGYQTNLVYWVANVVGNVSIVVAGVGYLTHFLPWLKDPWLSAFAQICFVWFFAYVNICGPKLVASIQVVATSVKLVPILGVALLGWFWFSPEMFAESWNVSGKSDISAIRSTITFTLWAFVGVESAAVSNAVVKNPRRNVPIATICGVLLAGFCYILSSSVIMGLIPNKELLASNAPFADAASLALGPIAGHIIAFCAALGCLGALGGWILLVSQSAQAAANDGLFGEVFSSVNKKGIPVSGLMIVAILMSLMILLSVSGEANQQFGKLSSIAVILTLMPYLYSCIAIKVLAYNKMSNGQYIFYVLAGLVGAIFCLGTLASADGSQVRWSLIFIVATVVFYSAAISRSREIAEGKIHVGGLTSPWLRRVSIAVAIAMLALCLYLS